MVESKILMYVILVIILVVLALLTTWMFGGFDQKGDRTEGGYDPFSDDGMNVTDDFIYGGMPDFGKIAGNVTDAAGQAAKVVNKVAEQTGDPNAALVSGIVSDLLAPK